MNSYDPKSLPQIDAVEIVDIRRLEPNMVSQYMDNAGSCPRVRREGDAAQPLADAWRALTPDMSARCHIPPIGFRFFCAGAVILEASVCWRCNNLFGLSEGTEISYAFDSDSEAAQALFTLAEEAMGSEVLDNG